MRLARRSVNGGRVAARVTAGLFDLKWRVMKMLNCLAADWALLRHLETSQQPDQEGFFLPLLLFLILHGRFHVQDSREPL